MNFKIDSYPSNTQGRFSTKQLADFTGKCLSSIIVPLQMTAVMHKELLNCRAY